MKEFLWGLVAILSALTYFVLWMDVPGWLKQ